MHEPVSIGRFVELLMDYAEDLVQHCQGNHCDPFEQELQSANRFARLIIDPAKWEHVPQPGLNMVIKPVNFLRDPTRSPLRTILGDDINTTDEEPQANLTIGSGRPC